jgi:hypothetical protein
MKDLTIKNLMELVRKAPKCKHGGVKGLCKKCEMLKWRADARKRQHHLRRTSRV